MDTPQDIPTPHAECLRAEVHKALKAKGSPTPTEIEEASIARGTKLDAQTITDFLSGRIMGWDRFKILITVLGAAKTDEDWNQWKKWHLDADKERHTNSIKKRQSSQSKPRHGGNFALKVDDPKATDQNLQAAGTSLNGVEDSADAAKSGTMSAVATLEKPQIESKADDKGKPEVDETPAVEDQVNPAEDKRLFWTPPRVITATAAAILVGAAAVIAVIATQRETTGSTPTPSTTAQATASTPNQQAAIKRGPEDSSGRLSWVEAPVDGSMVGQNTTMGKTFSLWSNPSISCDYTAPSPCLPGTIQSGKLALPLTIRAICIKTGQKSRNGTPGVDGYYEDVRWVRIAPGTGYEGSGYLSNVWFMRDKLPTNLSTCES